jgi:hypothetical protein
MPVTDFHIISQEADLKLAQTVATLGWPTPNPRGRPITEFEVQRVRISFGVLNSPKK